MGGYDSDERNEEEQCFFLISTEITVEFCNSIFFEEDWVICRELGFENFVEGNR